MFSWDSTKSASNLQKHGISFKDATALWDQEFEPAKLNVNDGEQVFLQAGYINGAVWGAMYIIRNSKIRILSARRLNERERNAYGFDR